MSRVLLANMPLFNLRWPNLALSLLKAALTRENIECDVGYFNFELAHRLGLEHYHWIADQFAFVLGGERLFARHYFGNRLPDDEEYFREVLLAADPELADADRRDYEATFAHIGPFLDDCMDTVNWSRYDVVGFSASLQQTMPSLCLAQRIKQQRPEIKILFGGAACEAEMGVELLRQFTEIDYVFLGEADLTFPTIVKQILAGGVVELPPGVVGRKQPATVGAESMVCDLDALPYPDFDDYFARLHESPFQTEIDPLFFFETARGCWWGQKHHCAFCGLNGSAIVFRRKSPKRAEEELRFLVEQYGVKKAAAADNILDPRYLDDFFPLLESAGLDLRFEYEMRTNLKRAQIDRLVAAGLGAAQLGIESFATPVLKLIGKGTTAVQNLQTLKWFSEAGVELKWNFLYGIPGEDAADYATMAELLPSLVHLAPPIAVGRVRMDRFSPYFDDPARFGMTNPRQHRAFRYVYPFDDEALRRLAYYFEYDYADGRNSLDYATRTIEAAKQWQELSETVTLNYFDRDDGVLILTDTRPCAETFQRRLSGTDRTVYLHCDEARSFSEIVNYIGDSGSPAALQSLLDEWLNARIMASADNRYLSLALRAVAE